MEMMQPVPQTTHPVLVSALEAALIFMLVIHHAQLIPPIVKTPIAIVRGGSADTVIIPAALLNVVITIAAAGSAALRKLVVLIIAIARTACVIIPRLIALTNAPLTNVLMVSVLIMLKATVKWIATVWLLPKELSSKLWITTTIIL
jgi:hypothetical protein